MNFRGLTWDHPRGYDALAAAACQVNGERGNDLITWDKQPLEGFESAPITDLASRYDLVVMDHPHIGEAVAENCLIPLEDLFEPAQIATWAAESIGPSLRSYEWQGYHWALPLDVATQVMARRADRVGTPPSSWTEIEAVASRLPVALSLAGPHAFLTLISMAAASGQIIGGPHMLPEDEALSALASMRRLARSAPTGSDRLNPIGLLDAMGRSDDIALVPLVFGYVTYARSGMVPNPVSFTDAIQARGGCLGGTGIAFSRRAAPSPELLDHIAWLMQPETQAGFIVNHGGQPSARTGWTSARVNSLWGDFYASTCRTAENALLRPRFDGFPAFTNAASAILRDDLAAGGDDFRLLTTIRNLWTDARARARGPLDDKRI